MCWVQSCTVQGDAACDQVAECGSVFSSGACAKCGMEKAAVGNVTSHTCRARATTGVRGSSDRTLVDFIVYEPGAFFNSGAISYTFANSARTPYSFPSCCRANPRL